MNAERKSRAAENARINNEAQGASAHEGSLHEESSSRDRDYRSDDSPNGTVLPILDSVNVDVVIGMSRRLNVIYPVDHISTVSLFVTENVSSARIK